jgi:hypothetical protein
MIGARRLKIAPLHQTLKDLELRSLRPARPLMTEKERNVSIKTYELPAKSTISECGKILSALRKLIDTNDDIVVSCDGCEQGDLALLQVLISARKSAQRDQKGFSVQYTADGTFDALLQQYGVRFSETV